MCQVGVNVAWRLTLIAAWIQPWQNMKRTLDISLAVLLVLLALMLLPIAIVAAWSIEPLCKQ